MADDVQINPGSGGAVIRTDELDGKHYQVIKIAFGADGTLEAFVSSTTPLPTLVKNKLVPERWDHVELSYNPDGTISTAVYKLGGPAGSIVATVALGYMSGKLTSVTRT